ncbi:MAG: MauE/DoxX family redox-associated membrane protein [Actinomycetota bacterium]|nr:MauE/DoxX family redox-associated membrane protein [Actinomycetota bacterium]
MNRSTVDVAEAIGVMAAVAVAVVLLVAGVSKLGRHDGWRAQAAGLGVPSVVAAVVPFVELALGSLLLVQVQRHVVAWFAVALFVLFTALLGVRLAQGRRPPCACFGSLSSTPIGPAHLLRNAVFIALSVAAAVL